MGLYLKDSTTSSATMYQSGYPVDNIQHTKISLTARATLAYKLYSLIGSHLWLSHATTPDFSTVTYMLANHLQDTGTQTIVFSNISKKPKTLESLLALKKPLVSTHI